MYLRNKLGNILNFTLKEFLLPFLFTFSIILIGVHFTNLRTSLSDGNVFLYSGFIILFLSLFLWLKIKNSKNYLRNINEEIINKIFITSSSIIILLRYYTWDTHIISQTLFAIIVIVVFLQLLNKKNTELDELEIKEFSEEHKRYLIFPNKYKTLGKVPLLNIIFRKIYTEGWFYCVILLLIMTLGLILRVVYTDYINASDLQMDLAVKNLYENGVFYYNSPVISTYLMLFFVSIFKFSFSTLKIPFIIYTLISSFLIYILAKNVNKTVGILSSFLFLISPWSIAISKITRDYSFDVMIGLIITLISFKIKEKYNDKTKNEIIKGALYISAISITFLIFIILNKRFNTLIVLVFPFTVFLSFVRSFFISTFGIKHRWASLVYNYVIVLMLAVVIYFTQFFNFKRGFVFNRFYFDVFFKSENSYIQWYGTGSPWHWFHGNNLPIYFLVLIFLFPIAVNYYCSRRNKFIYSLYSIFLLSLFIFTFKFVSQMEYNIPRYIYFLFPIYTIIISSSLYYLIKILNKNKVTTSILFFLLIFNFNSLYGVVFPNRIYETEQVTTLRADSTGIDRFEMREVANYITNILGISESDTLVIGPLWRNLVLLLNREMDSKRYLINKKEDGTVQKWDITKNTYVEDVWLWSRELRFAANNSEYGYLITTDDYIRNESNKIILELNGEDFQLYGKSFKFINAINGWRIYKFE